MRNLTLPKSSSAKLQGSEKNIYSSYLESAYTARQIYFATFALCALIVLTRVVFRTFSQIAVTMG